MKRYRLMLTGPAEADIDDAYRYIHQLSPPAAARWQAGLHAALNSLATMPERCTLAAESELSEFEIRQLTHGQYRALFTIMKDVVAVLHVRHGARRQMRADEIVPPEGI